MLPRVGGAAGDTGPSLRGVRAEKIADNLLLELRLETAMAIATCITYVFPNPLRQTLWTSMKRRFCLWLGESIRKHLRSLRLPPAPQDNVANVSSWWGVDD